MIQRTSEVSSDLRGRGTICEVAGLRTFYLQAGRGHPVLLVHGAAPGACSLVGWKQNIDSLAVSGLEVYAVDQPGFGHTDIPTDHSVDFRIAHLRSFVDQLELEHFIWSVIQPEPTLPPGSRWRTPG